MKLFCRKCEKEIKEYKIYPEECYGKFFSFKIKVFCHHNTEELVLNTYLRGCFDPSDYGDLYFFEKDEAEKSSCYDLMEKLDELIEEISEIYPLKQFKKDEPAKGNIDKCHECGKKL